MFIAWVKTQRGNIEAAFIPLHTMSLAERGNLWQKKKGTGQRGRVIRETSMSAGLQRLFGISGGGRAMMPSVEPLYELGNREEKMLLVKCWHRGREELRFTGHYISSMRLTHGAVTLGAANPLTWSSKSLILWSLYRSFFVPPPLGCGAIMFSGCLCIRVSFHLRLSLVRLSLYLKNELLNFL